ncbi:MAG: amidohydrolase family protein, partial [Hyphomicrobiales bacterium]
MAERAWTDTAVCLGHPEYPGSGEESDLMRRLDRSGVEKAWIFAYDSIASHDFSSGNRKVRDVVRRHPDRLVPIGLINPFMAFPMTDWLLDEGFAGIKLIAGWGNWLTIANMRRLVGPVAKALEARKRHISITVEGNNPTRGGTVWIPMVIREMAPDLAIVVDRCTIARGWEDYMALAETDPSLWFNVGTIPQGLLARVVGRIGAQRLLLGSWSPETDPDLLMTQFERAAPASPPIASLAAGNAVRVLSGLPPVGAAKAPSQVAGPNKLSEEDALQYLTWENMNFTATPYGVMTTANWMKSIGV